MVRGLQGPSTWALLLWEPGSLSRGPGLDSSRRCWCAQPPGSMCVPRADTVLGPQLRGVPGTSKGPSSICLSSRTLAPLLQVGFPWRQGDGQSAPLPQCPGTDRVLPVLGGGEAAAMDTQVPPCWVLAAVEDGAECCPSPPHTPCRCSQPPRGTSPPSHQALPPPAQPHLGTSRSSPLSG